MHVILPTVCAWQYKVSKSTKCIKETQTLYGVASVLQSRHGYAHSEI